MLVVDTTMPPLGLPSTVDVPLAQSSRENGAAVALDGQGFVDGDRVGECDGTGHFDDRPRNRRGDGSLKRREIGYFCKIDSPVGFRSLLVFEQTERLGFARLARAGRFKAACIGR